MSLSQAGAALGSAAPFALDWRGLAGYGHNSSADQAASSLNAASSRQPLTSDFGNNSAQVSLSDAARALAAFDGNGNNSSNDASGANGASGTSDFNQEALYLGGMTDASLVAMGIITPDQQAGTQITFDSLSYNLTSSASAGISQQNGQTIASYGTDQQAQFVGEGHITTADGRTFEFQVEVDLEQSQQIETAGGTGALSNTQSGGDSAALAANAAPSGVPPISDNASTGIASPTAASADSINWDAILNQSKSLIDLLESIGKPAGNAAGIGVNPAADAVSASGNATGAPAGDVQNASQNKTSPSNRAAQPA